MQKRDDHELPERFAAVPRAFTVATLAAHWDCSEGYVRKAIADGTLRPFYLGTAIRIRPDEVERFELEAAKGK